MATELLTIEVDNALNRDLNFKPLGHRNLRGRKDAKRILPAEGDDPIKWPDPLPGLRVSIDAASRAAHITEPLHEPQYRTIVKKLEKRGLEPLKERETFENIDVATWQYWAKRAVDSKNATLLSGKFPDHIPVDMTKIVKRSKPTSELVAAAMSSMAESNAQLAAAFEKLANALTSKK